MIDDMKPLPSALAAYRERTLEIIRGLRAGTFQVSDENREELILMIKDAAWARLVGEPVVLRYRQSFAYEYDRNGNACSFRYGKPLICDDGGKVAARAPMVPSIMAEYEKSRKAPDQPVWVQHALRMKEQKDPQGPLPEPSASSQTLRGLFREF